MPPKPSPSPQTPSPHAPSRTRDLAGLFAPGAWVIIVLAVLSSATILLLPNEQREGLEMWMFSPGHRAMYESTVVAEWRADADLPDINISVIGLAALERRMMGGFLSGVDTADLLEIERQLIGPVFAGPLDAVGFMDLTDWLDETGLWGRINEPSYSPWMSRGRVFGLPHDVHPVMLGYRADLIDAAGIDVSQIETWDDFRRVLAPLMTDADGDGEPDRYLLGFWPTQWEKIEMLLLQGGGRLFDEAGVPTLDETRNGEILAEIVSWCLGERRFAADVIDFTTASNNQKAEGYALAFFMPDWMCQIWKEQIPQLAGKVKLMPLPAFESDPKRRRTSVWGGSMLGIPKTSARREEALRFARELYFSEELAKTLYTESDIITPIVEHWDSPIFDEPDPFFMGQPKGRMYIDLAPSVPVRPSSPFSRDAGFAVRDAAFRTYQRAAAAGFTEPTQILPIATEMLERAQSLLQGQIERNVFLTSEGE